MSETDAEFLDGAEYAYGHHMVPQHRARLFALARRGAAAADEIARLRAGVDAGLKAATYTNEYKDPVSAHAEFMTCARVSLAIRAAMEGK